MAAEFVNQVESNRSYIHVNRDKNQTVTESTVKTVELGITANRARKLNVQQAPLAVLELLLVRNVNQELNPIMVELDVIIVLITKSHMHEHSKVLQIIVKNVLHAQLGFNAQPVVLIK